jgi:flavin-dependent dehydrogenase
MATQPKYDALIIGGGPGGSSSATFLGRLGRRVLVLEKEHFPRFHIGESLLPYNFKLFREMEFMPKLEAAGFVRKFGAQFHLGNGARGTKFVFRQGRYTREHEAIQVERAKFDHLLLQHAESCGAEVREGWTVNKFTNEGESVAVTATNGSGQSETFRAPFLIDASGRGNMTGNQEGIRVVHPRLKKLAVFGHFTGVKVDEGDRGSDTIVVRLHNKWFWLIPLSKEKVSVGCVMDQEEFARAKMPAAEQFHQIWQSSPEMVKRMKDSQLVTPIHTTSDFSYHNRRFVGPRLIRVGDAAGFMDPIFSAGVFLAMYSGKMAARAVHESLEAGDDGARRFAVYEKRIRSSMQFYWQMVESFYTSAFMEIFLEPREKLNLASAVNAVLAGELEGGWAMRWRMQLFFWIIKIQARFPLVPRISLPA